MRLPLAEATAVRLVFDPTRIVLNRFRCNVRFRDGREADLINQSYAGIAQFESQRTSPFGRNSSRGCAANRLPFYAGKPGP